MSYYRLTARDLHQKLMDKTCSAREITESVFGRIDGVEEKVGAYLTLQKESALAAAEAVDRRIAAGEGIHPLAGIPIAIKDNICTEGLLTTCASKMLYNFVPPYSATVIQKLNETGYVSPGRSTWMSLPWGPPAKTPTLSAPITPTI